MLSGMVMGGIGGEIIRCTETHPFQVKDKGWVDAENLTVGDLVYDKDWQTSPVQRVTLVTFDEPVAVYNFEVEDCHTYCIGNGCWLVHNGGCGNYKKVDSAAFERENLLKPRTFHRQVKKEITSRVAPDPHLVGINPDIMIDRASNIAYQGANGRGFQATGLNMQSILKELFNR